MQKDEAISILKKQIDKFNKETISNYVLISQTNDYLRQFLPPKAALLQLYHDKYLPLLDVPDSQINAHIEEIKLFLNNCIEYVNDIGITGELGIMEYELKIKQLQKEVYPWKDPKYLMGLFTGLVPVIIEFLRWCLKHA